MGEVDGDIPSGRVNCPLIVGTQEPFYGAHELDAKLGSQRCFEMTFNHGRRGKIDKIIDKDGNVNWGWPGIGVPWNRHGAWGHGKRPMLAKIEQTILYQ